jgi:hypothetical protein
MKIKKLKCWFPGTHGCEAELAEYEVGGKMPHSGASVVIQSIELTPTGGVIVAASGGLIKLVADVPMEMDISGVIERDSKEGEDDD